LKPAGKVLLQLGLHASFDLRRLSLAAFRAAHAEIGLRVLQPAGPARPYRGQVDLLIDRGLGHHPGYRCDRVTDGTGRGRLADRASRDGRLPRNIELPATGWLRRPADNALAMHRRRRLASVSQS